MRSSCSRVSGRSHWRPRLRTRPGDSSAGASKQHDQLRADHVLPQSLILFQKRRQLLSVEPCAGKGRRLVEPEIAYRPAWCDTVVRSQQPCTLAKEFVFHLPGVASRIGIEVIEPLPVGLLFDEPSSDGGGQPMGQVRLAGGDGTGDRHVRRRGVEVLQQPADGPAGRRMKHLGSHLGRRLRARIAARPCADAAARATACPAPTHRRAADRGRSSAVPIVRRVAGPGDSRFAADGRATPPEPGTSRPDGAIEKGACAGGPPIGTVSRQQLTPRTARCGNRRSSATAASRIA